jgi:CRISPR-associated endonuclease/helicase Cas3
LAPEESAEDERANSERSGTDDSNTERPEPAHAIPAAEGLKRSSVVALMLSSGGGCAGRYTLGNLAQERKGNTKREFEYEIAGRLLVLDARLGGLKNGLLDGSWDAHPETADTSTQWSEEVGFRVRPRGVSDPDDEGQSEASEWRFEEEFVLLRDADGNPREWLRLEHYREAARKKDARSIANPQELAEHQDWARREMLRIAKGIGLSGLPANALAVAAALHDEGKKADRWQRAFKAARDAQRCGLSRPLAKTRGPIDQALLDGYRHEFGSLRYVEKNAEFNRLPGEWRDLVLHLVAAHHGFARPVISIRGCDDGPPSLLEERARDVTMRFARLQKRWGPWVLAWWEALLRAADAQASRDNDEGRAPLETEKG